MNNITKRPPTIDEVIIKKDKTVSGTVHLPTGNTTGLALGTVLTTVDGGVNWNAQERDIWAAGSFELDAEVFHEGHAWKSLEAANTVEAGTDEAKWQDLGEFDANGILIENINAESKASVLATGDAREKYLDAYDVSMKHSLFKNKLILR